MSDLPTFKSTGFQHLDASIERAIEQAYKLGFDAGIEHQRKASPPPKARELAKQLDAARDAGAEAFDAALQAFAQLQEQLVALTAERDERRALVERLLGALINAEEKHINCECPTCDGDTGSGCTCSAPTQWRTVIAEARAAVPSAMAPLTVSAGAAATDLTPGEVTYVATKPDMATLRMALRKMHRRACGDESVVYMSIPADRERDADLLLEDALDELAAYRALAPSPRDLAAVVAKAVKS